METLKHPKRYVKAIYAAVTTALGGIVAVYTDGITTVEWLGVALTTIVAAGGVYGLTNATDTEGN